MRLHNQLVLLSSFFLVLQACGDKKPKVAPPQGNAGAAAMPPMKVDAYLVQPESFGEAIEVPGNILANEATEIHPEVSGRLVYLNPAEGRIISKGTLLAKLFDGDLVAQLKKLEVQLALAEKTEERQAQLLKIQGISQADYDISLLQVNNLKADIGIIKTSIAKTEVRAPFSGKLGLRNISTGAYVSPATVIAVINQTNQLKLDFTVPEKYTGALKQGQTISFTYEGSSAPLSAKIIATESTITENTRSLTARAIVTSKDDKLIPGTFAKVVLRFAPDPDALLIPSQAIVPQARGKKVVLIQNGKAVFTDIETGVRDSSRVQILQGVKPGDTVVVTGLLSIRPDAPVQAARIINLKK